ncbi:kinase-like protein [Ascobolus immersus RN42]|uniref:Kinase-like protein n=1 Tax=Ascobolus immersus RN42 TaxID=1160509 RepID=A0A3N4ISH0_ASCIM|nr:kinase-like protein [Ascobolus immersus RN42]
MGVVAPLSTSRRDVPSDFNPSNPAYLKGAPVSSSSEFRPQTPTPLQTSCRSALLQQDGASIDSNGNPTFHNQPQHNYTVSSIRDLRVQTSSLPMTIPRSRRPSSAAYNRPSNLSAASRSSSYEASPAFSTMSGTSSLASSMDRSDSFYSRNDSYPKMTPLPSPIVRGDSPGPWNRFRSRSFSRPLSRGGSVHKKSESVFVTLTGESVATALAAHAKRQKYHGLAMPLPESTTTRTQNCPVELVAKKVLGDPEVTDNDLHREKHLARATLAQRRSSSNLGSIDSSIFEKSASSASSVSSVECYSPDTRLIRRENLEEFEITEYPSEEKKKLHGMKLLGTGTFSKVILASSEARTSMIHKDEEVYMDPKRLMAVKILESKCAGSQTTDVDRVESSLKRELGMLKTLNHPSLIKLRGYNIQSTRALIVLSHYAGGDLFDFAKDHRDALTPQVIRRIFAETITALVYMHKNNVVHRDVKLENILMAYTREELDHINESPEALYNYPHSISVLSDLGLSKQIDPENPLLDTRCGSEDYAAPELIMAQPYDGRAVDAWALGVTLYCLLEHRLPFDPPVTPKGRSKAKTAHLIARCDWKWYNLKDEEGMCDDLIQAKKMVSALLQRANKRVKLSDLVEDEWVKGAIQTELIDSIDH